MKIKLKYCTLFGLLIWVVLSFHELEFFFSIDLKPLLVYRLPLEESGSVRPRTCSTALLASWLFFPTCSYCSTSHQSSSLGLLFLSVNYANMCSSRTVPRLLNLAVRRSHDPTFNGFRGRHHAVVFGHFLCNAIYLLLNKFC